MAHKDNKSKFETAYEVIKLNSVCKITCMSMKSFGKRCAISEYYANDAAAKAAGLGKGDIYHTAGVLKVVTYVNSQTTLARVKSCFRNINNKST